MSVTDGTNSTPDTPVEPRPAATVVLLRDGEQDLETLLLRRNKALSFAGGIWVFPGGALDAADLQAVDGDVDRAARVAAAREAEEEAGMSPDPSAMVQISHWTTPEAEPKRFFTWFYAARCTDQREVVIDGSEIHDSQWIGVADAISQHEGGDLGLFPPTYLTLRRIAHYNTAAEALVALARLDPPRVFPVFAVDGDLITVLFEGDAGYSSGDACIEGARHRAVLEGKCWRYLHEGLSEQHPPLDMWAGS